MKKIAIITPPLFGHTFPTVSLGKELIKRGHEVYWFNMPFMSEIIPQEGNFIPLEDPNEREGEGQSEVEQTFTSLGGTTEKSRNSNHFGIESLKVLYTDVLVPLNHYLYDKIGPMIDKTGFDLIVTDQQAFAGAALAYNKNIPFVTSVTTPAPIDLSEDYPEVMSFENGQIVDFQKSRDIPLEHPLVCKSPVTLIYGTTQFILNDKFPGNYKFVGPCFQDRYDNEIDISEYIKFDKNQPIVLVTMGSVLARETRLIDKFVEAFHDEKLNIILIADPEIKDKWPDNFNVYQKIPQIKVLEKVQAVVCHAGYNTVSESLGNGVPLITLPVAYDQSYVATRVKESGAGIRLKYKRLTTKALKESINELLLNENYTNAAYALKESYKEAGGAISGADHIEKMLSETKKSILWEG